MPGDDTGTLITHSDARRRSMAFFREYMAAPNDADVELRLGKTEAGDPAVVIRINDGPYHGFTTSEARTVASIAERTMRAFPTGRLSLENLIMGLRAAADKADRNE